MGVAKGDHVTTGIKAYDMHACAMATSPLPAVADGSEDVAYCMHYAGAWHVSLTKGFRCVDLRKFFIPTDQTVWKPTKTGIALRLNEWPTFKQAVDKLHRDNPTVANFTPCFLNLDHTTLEIIATCPECNPYPSTTA